LGQREHGRAEVNANDLMGSEYPERKGALAVTTLQIDGSETPRTETREVFPFDRRQRKLSGAQ
jgi:hypothetical protein